MKRNKKKGASHPGNAHDKRGSDNSDWGEKLRIPVGFDGPLKYRDRKTTDVLFSFLLVLAWGCFAYIGFYSYQNGRPERIVHPSDYKGRLCGFDNIFFDEDGNSTTSAFLPSKWAPADYLGNGACVASCPNVTDLQPSDRSGLICKDDDDLLEMEGCTINGEISSIVEQLVLCGGCMYPIKSFDTPLDYCIPAGVSNVVDHIDHLANLTGLPSVKGVWSSDIIPFLERLANDLWTTRKVIAVIGLGASSVLSFAVLLITWVPGLISTVFWSSALTVPALAGFGGYYAMCVSKRYKTEAESAGLEVSSVGAFYSADTTIFALDFFTFAGYIGAVVILLALCFLRHRIQLAIGITRASARAVVAIPMSPFYPVVQLMGYIAFFVPWFITLLLLGSTGVPIPKTQEVFDGKLNISYTAYEFNKEATYFFWYLIFILFWTSQFVVALGQITMAVCFSKWYFTADKKGRVGISVARAMVVSFCKHFGTAAFGSLIVAIVQFCRTVLLWTQKKLKEAGGSNKCTQTVLGCLQCLLACVEKCLKYISKNAYIQTAMFGHPFCRGAKEAFGLVVRNAARMAAVSLVSELCMVFLKLFVLLCVSIASFYVIDELYSHQLFSVAGAVVIIALLSWFIASMFTEVLGIAVSTVLQCFLADEEMFGGNRSPYVPKELRDFLKHLDKDGYYT